MARQSLESWIAEVLSDTEQDPGPAGNNLCHMISLVHMQGGQNQVEVHNYKVGGKKFTENEIGKLLRGKAEAFAQDLAGTQTFWLLAFYGGANQPGAKHPFTVTGEEDRALGATEGPTGQGLVQMAMRHAEMTAQLGFRQQAMLFQQSQNMIEFLARENHTLKSENQDMFGIFRQMAMETATANDERQAKHLAFQRATDERKALLKFAPALVNTITGKEVFPESTADTALVETIADVLDEKMMMSLAGRDSRTAHESCNGNREAQASGKRARECRERAWTQDDGRRGCGRGKGLT